MNENLNRYEVTLTKGTEKVHTFTWATTRNAAVARVVDHLEDPIWDGYSFEVK
jgi:hypothetical protein